MATTESVTADRKACPSQESSTDSSGPFAVAVIDQVRAVSRERLVSRIETASADDIVAVGEAIGEILELP